MSAAAAPTPGGARRASAPPGFRSDINGLRAVSIALVMAFHLAPDLAPGGFIGVDVFFVISGYLMTRIVVADLRRGRFRLGDFYLARLRRIWPALAALCAVLCLAGFLLDPWSQERLAQDIPGALLFVSNFVFAARVGYFAPSEAGAWLLHTWSLSVEWQFYLVYPLLLIGLYRTPALRPRPWLAIAALATGSLVLALVFWTRRSELSFYLLPMRAWELLAGALCVPIEGRWRPGGGLRAIVHGAGLALIVIGAVVASPVAGWPGPAALLPVGGAALVITSALGRTLWAETAMVSRLGRASYSIYIWHWPVIVALRYAGVALTAPVAAAAVAAMIGLGWLSYQLIERRATSWLIAPRPAHWAAGLAGIAAIAAFAVVGAQTRGFEAQRTAGLAPTLRAALADDRKARDDWRFPDVCQRLWRQGPLRVCQMGDPAARQVVVIGDSHADQYAPRYAHAFAARPGAGVTFVTQEGCVSIPGVGVRRDRGRCARWSAAAYSWAVTAGFRRVVIATTWSPYFDPAPGAPSGILCLAGAGDCDFGTFGSPADAAGAVFPRLAQAIVRLRQAGVEVVLVGPTPRGPAADPTAVYAGQFWRRDAAAPPLVRSGYEAHAHLVLAWLATVSRITGAPLVDSLAALCPQGLCAVVSDGRALYKDGSHLRAATMTLPRYAYLDPWLAPAPPAAARTRLK